MTGKKLALLILSSIGGLLLPAGLGLLLLGRSQAQEIERLAGGQVLHTLTQLSQTPPGVAVMLQGKIAECNSPFEQEFVAYVRQQHRGELPCPQCGQAMRLGETLQPKRHCPP